MITLGTFDDAGGAPTAVDLPRLLETRMLVQANSGGGKSWALRRLLEQTAPDVQQLVIDPEGEFSTLRERFDYVIAAPRDGDAVATPQTAALLARRLLETGVSAILDIYDLKAHERQAFVKRFLDALVNAPRKLWHPVLVVIDEAHVFCPQAGGAEAAGAVIDVCTRGRKRGLCPVLATQRLSKLHKDAAAEMLNKLVGRTGLDVDVKRAADELGMPARDATAGLRTLQPGDFYAFGPALTNQVRRVVIGPVETSHPQSGHRLMAPPPAPSARVREQLAKLADLQKEAAQEAADTESLRRRVMTLERELQQATAQRNALDCGPDRVTAAEAKRREDAAYARGVAAGGGQVPENWETIRGLLWRVHKLAGLDRHELSAAKPDAFQGIPVVFNGDLPACSVELVGRGGHVRLEKAVAAAGETTLRAGALKILRELAARSPAGYTRAQVGALTGFSASGGTFGTYFSNLKKAGFLEERDGLVFATDAGVAHLGGDVPPAPTTHEEAMALWKRALRSGAFRMLEVIVTAGQDGVTRDQLGAAIDMAHKGGTFGTYLSNLRTNGLVTESGGRLVANTILFPGAIK
ncbi:MAG: DUF87 domain-containing protein [Lysobacter sp.]|nr:DUF87 domain-containing protein [Lysobacter sp.]